MSSSRRIKPEITQVVDPFASNANMTQTPKQSPGVAVQMSTLKIKPLDGVSRNFSSTPGSLESTTKLGRPSSS